MSRCHWPACVPLERVAAVAGGGGVQRERVPFRGSHSSANTAPPERNPGASEPALLTADDSVGAGGRHRVVHLFVCLEPGILESRGVEMICKSQRQSLWISHQPC